VKGSVIAGGAVLVHVIVRNPSQSGWLQTAPPVRTIVGVAIPMSLSGSQALAASNPWTWQKASAAG
jgi:hypothetical protein